ncbi:MAG: hypothetical protein LBT75_02860 [Bacilli bacterium]|jgi:diaminopimelate epimerase|nr:hypothetical protein [Bacilli bacterium]
MELKIVIANPAGNITAFVLNDIKQADYQKIAHKIMALPNLEVEQVAFVTNSKYEPYQMNMMGLEFCGNATRCFGYLVAKLNKLTKDIIQVEVSGSNEILNVEISHNPARATVEVSKPLSIENIINHQKTYPLVVFEGIAHLIIEDKEANQKEINELLSLIDENYPNDAYGILYYNNNTIDPHVYVKATNSLVNESSCGSGAIAVAYYLHHLKNKGIYHNAFEFKGGVIETIITINNQDIRCFMGGIINMSNEIYINIETKE